MGPRSLKMKKYRGDAGQPSNYYNNNTSGFQQRKVKKRIHRSSRAWTQLFCKDMHMAQYCCFSTKNVVKFCRNTLRSRCAV